MTSTLIRGASIRIADGRIAAIGELSAEPGERNA